MKSLQNRLLMAAVIVLMLFSSCKKLVEVNPPVTSTNGINVYETDATAAAVLTGIYANISANNFLGTVGVNSLPLFTGLSSDELSLYSGVSNTLYLQYYKDAIESSNNFVGAHFWLNAYPIIYITNSAIEGISNSSSLSSNVRQQLLGEAKFVRAFCYFYLVNLYGDVPLVLSSDYKVNANLTRTSREQVWLQIIDDLKAAEGLLSIKFLDGTILKQSDERLRPTKWAATALLARSFLYTSDWANAEAKATEIINNNGFFSLSTLDNAFLKNSSEAIWQLQPVNAGWNTWDARVFILPSTGPRDPGYPVYLSSSLTKAFETGDLRKLKWTDSSVVGTTTFYYPHKYKSATQNSDVTEYTMMLRLSEQYLIRSEARAQQGKIAEAASDLNALRHRAGLPNTTATDKSSLITAILRERQVELFTEGGHRWLDLKRTGNVNAVMTLAMQQKGGAWNSDKQLYPIPLSELQRDPNLTQNLGY